MTARHALHDEQIINQLLLETGSEEAEDLKAALLELRCFRHGPAVLPSPELAALMTAGPLSLKAYQRRKHRRTALTALAIAASMGIGTAAVAATDPRFREKAQQAITSVVEVVTHGQSVLPAPEPARSPGSPPTPAHVPHLPAPAQGTPGNPAAPGGPPANPPATGAGKEQGSPPHPNNPNRPAAPSAPSGRD
ncbi:hypothetical protein [Arthrobacter sp. SLBN-112]|uniref:hypothetical protein n=1 Tax=Arthrobacter sp. SLBN-112 TaxID=2768452 RepID=UPI0027B69C29|nr:hypothetical protein [Arthrobacter sp. SLBN-112]MDQ0798917.1 hypothetical protein [Arthrobacter sp. SLBN-112]